jgi:hypothetical protein
MQAASKKTQQDIVKIVVGINRVSTQRICQTPQEKIDRVYRFLDELRLEKSNLLLFFLYQHCVENFDHVEKASTLTPNEKFISQSACQLLVEKCHKAEILNSQDELEPEVRSIILACYLPYGSENYALIYPRTSSKE